MAALADPQDQGNWPSLSFEGSGAQNGSKEKGAGNISLAGAGSSSTKPLGEQLAEEHNSSASVQLLFALTGQPK